MASMAMPMVLPLASRVALTESAMRSMVKRLLPVPSVAMKAEVASARPKVVVKVSVP